MKPYDLFFGMTDREVAIALITEMRRRGLYGCVFVVPDKGGSAIFGSSTPANTVTGLTAAEQLAIFASVAAHAEGERSTTLPDDTVLNTSQKKEWMN